MLQVFLSLNIIPNDELFGRLVFLHRLESLQQAGMRVVVSRVEPVLVRARQVFVHQLDERRREESLVSGVKRTGETIFVHMTMDDQYRLIIVVEAKSSPASYSYRLVIELTTRLIKGSSGFMINW